MQRMHCTRRGKVPATVGQGKAWKRRVKAGYWNVTLWPQAARGGICTPLDAAKAAGQTGTHMTHTMQTAERGKKAHVAGDTAVNGDETVQQPYLQGPAWVTA